MTYLSYGGAEKIIFCKYFKHPDFIMNTKEIGDLPRR